MTFEQPGPIAQLRWALIDLDGTLAESVWTPEDPTSRIGDPIPVNVAKALQLHADGWKLTIHTSRPWTDYEAIESWCHYHSIPIRRIICGKLLGGVMIDDRNVPIDSPDWSDPDGATVAAWYDGYAAGKKDAEVVWRQEREGSWSERSVWEPE